MGHPFYIILTSLAKAGSRDLLDKLLAEMPEDDWRMCDTPLWKSLHDAFGIDVFHNLHAQFLEGNVESSRYTLFPLLDALLMREDASSIAATITARLALLEPQLLQASAWNRPTFHSAFGDVAEARILLSASHLLATPEDKDAVHRLLLADQSLDYVRHILVPAVLAAQASTSHSASLIPELHRFATDTLAAEIARPLHPFPNWTRPCPKPSEHTPSRMGYQPSPAHREAEALSKLYHFMIKPTEIDHQFRYPEAIRNSLIGYIQHHNLDLDHTTIRKGSPHILYCVKNDKSYKCILARRAEDAELHKKMFTIRANVR